MGILNWVARRMLGIRVKSSDDVFHGAKIGGAYQGAGSGTGVQDWLSQSLSADAANAGSLQRLRDRSRDLARNNDYARQFMRLVADNVVGPKGIRLQSQVRNSRGLPNTKANEKIEEAWREWGENCDASGHTWWSVQRLVARSLAESGEVFIRLIRRDMGGLVPLYLQILEAEMVDETYEGLLATPGNMWRQGVEVDEFGKPQRYAVRRVHPGDRSQSQLQRSEEYQLVPASDIIHVFQRERPGQTRGVPFLHSSMGTVKQMGDYVKTEIIRARGASSLMGFIHDIDSDGLAGTGEGGPADEIESETWRPGTFRRLNPGETISIPQMQAPTGQYDPFVRSLLGSVAAGAGCSYESLSRDYSRSNYSSSRLALIQERETWRCLQRLMIEEFCERVFQEWLPLALLAKRLPVGQVNVRERYKQHQWQARGWQWVDPQREVQAQIQAVQGGFRTLADVVAETGHDLDEVLEARQRELAMLEEMGIPVSTTPTSTGSELPSDDQSPPQTSQSSVEDEEQADAASQPDSDDDAQSPPDSDDSEDSTQDEQ